ncbi:MAG: hypothetical protein ACKO1K_02500, partial [Burkholderiales bacterium]
EFADFTRSDKKSSMDQGRAILFNPVRADGPHEAASDGVKAIKIIRSAASCGHGNDVLNRIRADGPDGIEQDCTTLVHTALLVDAGEISKLCSISVDAECTAIAKVASYILAIGYTHSYTFVVYPVKVGDVSRLETGQKTATALGKVDDN